MKKWALISVISLLFAFLLMFCFSYLNRKNSFDKEIIIDEKEDADEAGSNWENEGSEKAETNRKFDNTLDMEIEDIRNLLLDCTSVNPNFKSSVDRKLIKDLYYYFPNPIGWWWDIIGKEEDDYVLQIQSYDDGEYGKYQLQALLKPDFSIVLLEDTIEVDIEKGFCVYKADEEYFYHGCKIADYNVEYHDQARDIYYKVVIPLFSTQESTEWREINCNIWEGVENWITENDIYQNGRLLLDYEIKTLDNNLYSIFFSGEFESGGKTETIGTGITISMISERILPKSVFIDDGKSECFYDFYIEDNKLFLIINGNERYKLVEDKSVCFLEYFVVERERQVFDSVGRWIGKCYYELPVVGYYGIGTEWINQQMKSDMGKFFNEVAKKFEEEALELGEKEEERIVYYYETPQYYCNVESEIIKNNEGEFGVRYHYTFCLGEVYEEGDAAAIYNLEKEIVEYEDWQEEIMEKLSGSIF